MRRTGVFATTEETEEIAKLASEARSTPVIAMSMDHGIEQGGFAGQAWDRVHKTVYEKALAHGLPEIRGYYGFDPENGEFIDN